MNGTISPVSFVSTFDNGRLPFGGYLLLINVRLLDDVNYLKFLVDSAQYILLFFLVKFFEIQVSLSSYSMKVRYLFTN